MWQAYNDDYADTLILQSRFNENVKLNYLKMVSDIVVSSMLQGGIQLVNAQTDSVIDELAPVQTILNEALSWLIRNGVIEGTVIGRYTSEGIEPLTSYNVTKEGDTLIAYTMMYDSRYYFYKVRNQWVIEQQSVTGQEIFNRYLWPYETKPYVLFHHKDPVPGHQFGRGEFSQKDVTTIQAINFLLGNAVRIVRYQANKKPVGTGFNANSVATSPDGILVLPAGANMWTLDTTADLTGTLALKDQLVSSFLEVHSIPPVVLGQLNSVGKLSALALEVLYGPLHRKVTTLRTYSYTPALRKMLEAILLVQSDMNVVPLYDVNQIKIKWPNLYTNTEIKAIERDEVENE